jgi:hypothetical protein
MPSPWKKTPAPSVRYACFATSNELSRLSCNSGCRSARCSLCMRRSLCRTCVCTLVLITSSGNMVAQVTTPAKPPQSRTFMAVSLSESFGDVHACFVHSYDQKLFTVSFNLQGATGNDLLEPISHGISYTRYSSAIVQPSYPVSSPYILCY